MSRSASYGKTKRNNKSEDLALKVLLKASSAFQRPDSKTRNRILELLGLAGEFSNRVFDLIQSDTPIPPLHPENVAEHIDSLRLVEVKATKKPIADENLHRFFFGATDNEYRLARHLEDRYKFAFVVLLPKDGRPPFFVLLTLQEVEERTKTKRVQYQVNFRGPTKNAA
jgi:hypothetical protein